MDPVFWESGGFKEGCVWRMISAGLDLGVYGGRGCRSRSESQCVGREELTSLVGWWPDLSWSWSESRIVWLQTSAQGTPGSFWVSHTEPWPRSVSAGKRWRRLGFKVKFLCFFKFFQGLGNEGLLITFTSSSGFPLSSARLLLCGSHAGQATGRNQPHFSKWPLFTWTPMGLWGVGAWFRPVSAPTLL